MTGFALTRVLALVAASLAGGSRLWTGPEGLGQIAKGDGGWYIGIAASGYDGLIVGDNPAGLSNMAHFPLFPALIRALSLSGITPQTAGVVISALASLIAAWGLVRFGEELGSATAGVVLAVLWGVQPAAVGLSMVLTESLFTALAVWTLVLLLRGRLLLAATMCLAAGLTRPTAVALVLAVAWAAIASVRAGRGRARALLAVILSAVGVVGYVGYVGMRTGRWDGYIEVQRQWRSSVDWGRSLIEALPALTDWVRVPVSVSLLLVMVGIVLFGCLLAMRLPSVVVVYTSACLLLIIVQSNYIASRERFLLVVFPLLWPIAVWLSRRPRWVAVSALCVLAVLSAWYGTFLLFTWPHSV